MNPSQPNLGTETNQEVLTENATNLQDYITFLVSVMEITGEEAPLIINTLLTPAKINGDPNLMIKAELLKKIQNFMLQGESPDRMNSRIDNLLKAQSQRDAQKRTPLQELLEQGIPTFLLPITSKDAATELFGLVDKINIADFLNSTDVNNIDSSKVLRAIGALFMIEAVTNTQKQDEYAKLAILTAHLLHDNVSQELRKQSLLPKYLEALERLISEYSSKPDTHVVWLDILLVNCLSNRNLLY